MIKLTSCFLLLLLVLTSSVAFADPYFCSAPWPPPAGSDRTMGKDSDGHTCIKIAKTVETAPIASPVAAPVKVGEISAKPEISQPAKDLLRSQGTVEGITVTLSTNAKGEPVMSAFCENGETGINRWDVQMYKMGYHQVHTKIGDTVVTSYEK